MLASCNLNRTSHTIAATVDKFDLFGLWYYPFPHAFCNEVALQANYLQNLVLNENGYGLSLKIKK